MPYKI